MTSLCLLLALSLTAAPASELHPKGFKAELLVDANEVLVGDVVVSKLRVENQDRVTLQLWSPENEAGTGYARYEFRRDEGEWQDYRQLEEKPDCTIRGRYSMMLAPKQCQSELTTWEQNHDRQRVFSRPGTYRLRAHYMSALGELVTPEIKIKVSSPAKGDTVERADFPLRLPWKFTVGEPVNLQIADSMEACNSRQILHDMQRLNEFLTTGMVDRQPISLAEFLKWLDKQNPVRRECLLVPMGHACVRHRDVEALREVLKRMPDRSSHQNELSASLEKLEILPR